MMTESKEGKALAAARDVFLRYGYKRVSMKDIAEAAGVSRPALYVVFSSKEAIFIGVFGQWVDETIAEIERGFASLTTPEEKLEYAFEIWTVRPFEMALKSPEAQELIECSFDFARDSLRQAYEKFEAILVPVLASLAGEQPAKHLRPKAIAHVLASAARGFKQTASTKAELRLLIRQLVALSAGALRREHEVR